MTGTTAPVVIKISGKAVDQPRSCTSLWESIVGLSRRVPVAIVHGGGIAVDRRLDSAGFSTVRKNGLRVTPAEQMPIVNDALAGQVNGVLCEVLAEAGGSTEALGVCDLGLCSASAISGLGRVGEAAPKDGTEVLQLMASGSIPVIHSIGKDENGQPLNINADDAAAAIALSLGASRLLLLTDVLAVLGADTLPIRELDIDTAEYLMSDGTAQGGMEPKLRAAMAFATRGKGDAVIGSWTELDVLLPDNPDAGTRVFERRRSRRIHDAAAACSK